LGQSLYLNIFQDLKFFNWLGLADDPRLCQVFRGMLEKFTKLKQLTVRNYLPTLFEDNFLCEGTSFNLNELNLILSGYNHIIQRRPTYYGHIVSFLMKQKLEKLTLEGILLTEDIISSVLAMFSLKSLTIEFCSFASLPLEIATNYSVQKLCIHYINNVDDGIIQGLIFILSSCLNARELILFGIVITNKLSTAIAEKMKNLQKLKIDYCEIPTPSVAYPSINSIEIHTSGYGTFFNDIIELVRANPQVKCLKLPSRFEFHPMYHFLMNELNLDELYLYDEEYKRPFQSPPTTLMKNLDNLMFVPFVLFFMYMFHLFVLFTSSDPPDYNM